MYLHYVAIRPVKPSDDDELVAGRYALQPVRDLRIHFDPGIVRAFIALLRRVGPILQRRTDQADRTEQVFSLWHNTISCGQFVGTCDFVWATSTADAARATS